MLEYFRQEVVDGSKGIQPVHSMIQLQQVNKDLSCTSFAAIEFNSKTITNIENQPEALATNLKPLLQT